MKVYEVKMVLASKAVKVGHEVVDRNNLRGFSFVQRRPMHCIGKDGFQCLVYMYSLHYTLHPALYPGLSYI